MKNIRKQRKTWGKKRKKNGKKTMKKKKHEKKHEKKTHGKPRATLWQWIFCFFTPHRRRQTQPWSLELTHHFPALLSPGLFQEMLLLSGWEQRSKFFKSTTSFIACWTDYSQRLCSGLERVQDV